MLEAKRQEEAYKRRLYRHKAHYSLDRGDGIECGAFYSVAGNEDGPPSAWGEVRFL